MALDMNNFSTDMTEKKPFTAIKSCASASSAPAESPTATSAPISIMPDVEIVAACDLIPGKAEKFLKEYDVEGAPPSKTTSR